MKCHNSEPLPHQVGMFNAIPGSELEIVQDSIDTYGRVMKACFNLAELYKDRASKCTHIAGNFEQQGRESAGNPPIFNRSQK